MLGDRKKILFIQAYSLKKIRVKIFQFINLPEADWCFKMHVLEAPALLIPLTPLMFSINTFELNLNILIVIFFKN